MPKPTDSIIVATPVANLRRRFGAARIYYPAMVSRAGQLRPALFTEDQLLDAMRRAEAQPEDAPRPSWLARLIAAVT